VQRTAVNQRQHQRQQQQRQTPQRVHQAALL
jgi:hypothetical protein